MKRIVGLILIAMLILTACGSKETLKTEEELRAEIKAEMEAEAKLKEELRTEMEEEEKSKKESSDEAAEEEQENTNKRDDVYYQDDLVKGTKVSDKFTLTEDFHYNTDGCAMAYDYSLECNDYVKATLIYEEEWDFYSIRIEEPIFDKNVIINSPIAPNGEDEQEFLREGVTSPINFEKSTVAEDFLVFVKENKYHYLQGSVYVKTFEVSENEVEGTWNLVVSDFTPNDSELDRIKQPVKLEGALDRFDNETLLNNYEDIYIDYPKYHLVVIPMQDSINADKLSKRTINVTDTGNEYPLKFTVLGELSMLEITYIENGLDSDKEPTKMTIEGPFKDEIITLNTYLPNDFSSVKVSGNYIYLSGVDGFEFALNDMADPEAYEILTFEAQVDNRGEY